MVCSNADDGHGFTPRAHARVGRQARVRELFVQVDALVLVPCEGGVRVVRIAVSAVPRDVLTEALPSAEPIITVGAKRERRFGVVGLRQKCAHGVTRVTKQLRAYLVSLKVQESPPVELMMRQVLRRL